MVAQWLEAVTVVTSANCVRSDSLSGSLYRLNVHAGDGRLEASILEPGKRAQRDDVVLLWA
jgi:hypothetical protein